MKYIQSDKFFISEKIQDLNLLILSCVSLWKLLNFYEFQLICYQIRLIIHVEHSFSRFSNDIWAVPTRVPGNIAQSMAAHVIRWVNFLGVKNEYTHFKLVKFDKLFKLSVLNYIWI